MTEKAGAPERASLELVERLRTRSHMTKEVFAGTLMQDAADEIERLLQERRAAPQDAPPHGSPREEALQDCADFLLARIVDPVVRPVVYDMLRALKALKPTP